MVSDLDGDQRVKLLLQKIRFSATKFNTGTERGKGRGTIALKIYVTLVFGASIIIFFFLLWYVLVGRVSESYSLGLYLFYALTLLGTGRVLQTYLERLRCDRENPR